MNYAEVYAALRQRKLAQTVVVYAGASWGILQVLSFFVSTYGWSRSVIDAALFVLACGLVGAVTIAWFHGEKGEQRVTRVEVAILTLVGLVAASGGWGLARRSVDEAVAEDGAPLSDQRLAVLPFENRTGDASLAWLQEGLPEMLSTDLGQLPRLHVVSGERVFDLLKQQGVAEASFVSDPLAMKVAKKASAATLVRGYVYRSGGEFRLDVKLIRASTGVQMNTAFGTGPDLVHLVDTVAAKLAAQLTGVTGGSAPMSASLADMATGNMEAYKEYQAGLDAERNLRVRDALPHFQRAVALDSTFAQALTHLAVAEMNVGDGSGALEHLLAAQRNLGHASQRDSLFVGGIIAFSQNDHARAIADLEELTQKYPDEKDSYVLLSGMVPDPARREALLEKVLKLDPYYTPAYNQLAYAHLARKEFAAADSFARKYVKLSPNEPNPLDTRGEVLELWGKYGEARAAYLGALRLRPDFTSAIGHLVRNAERSGRLDEARADLAPFTGSDNGVVRVTALLALTETYMWQGRLDDVRTTLQRAYDRAAGADPQLRLSALGGLAGTYAMQGDYARAAQLLQPEARGGTSIEFQYLGVLGEMKRFDDMEARHRAMAQYGEQPGKAAYVAGPLHLTEALIAYYRGDWARAIDAFRAAKQALHMRADAVVDPREVLALVNAGRPAEALPLLNYGDARVFTAGSVNSHLYLSGRVYEALGRRADAAAAYRQLLAHWGAMIPRMPSWRDVPRRLAQLGG